MAENGNEKKNTRARRTPLGEKKQDQVLSGAVDAPKLGRIGKIAGPKQTEKKPEKAEKSGQRTKTKTDAKKQSSAKQNSAKKSGEKAASSQKKGESTRKIANRGGRKPQKPALSQTVAQVEA